MSQTFTTSLYAYMLRLEPSILKTIYTTRVWIEPRNAIRNRFAGAGRWYIVYVSSNNSLARITEIGLTIANETHVLLNIRVNSSGAYLSGLLNASIRDYRVDMYHSILVANVTIPWSINGTIFFIGHSMDRLGLARLDNKTLYFINEVVVKPKPLRKLYPTNTSIVISGRVVYKYIGLPVENERITVLFNDTMAGVSASSSDGLFRVRATTPVDPGDYIVTIKPLHGEPVCFNITVLPPELGGKPVTQQNTLFLTITPIILATTLLILYITILYYRSTKERQKE